MTQPSITDEPASAEVERFIGLIRTGSGDQLQHLYPSAFGVITALVDDPEALRNAVKAAVLLHRERVRMTLAQTAKAV